MNRIVNFRLETFVLGMLTFSFFCFDKEVFFCLFIIFIIFMIMMKQNIIDFFINIIGATIFNFIYTKYNSINFIPFNNLFNSLIGTDLRNSIIQHVEENFSTNSIGFIKLIIFNVKDESIKDFYNKLSELSLSHLVVVSGFHLSLMPIIFSKLIRNKFISIPVNIFIMLFINYLTVFSFGAFRAFLFYLFSLNKRTKKASFWLSLLVIMLIAPFSSLTVSLQMSFIGVFALKIRKINNNRDWNSILLTSLVCTMFVIPYIGYFAKKISLLFIVYSLVFTPFILFLYVLTLIFFWLPQYEFILKYLLIFVFDCVTLSSMTNIFIPINSANIFSSFLYWIIIFAIFNKKISSNILEWSKILYSYK